MKINALRADESDDLDSFLDEIEAQEMALGMKIDEMDKVHKPNLKSANILGENMNESMNKKIEEQVIEDLYYHKRNEPHPPHILE